MYTVEISNVCAETVAAHSPKKALEVVVQGKNLPYKILRTKDITNSNQIGAKVCLIGGTRESVTYYILERV